MNPSFLTDREIIDMMRSAGIRPSAQRLAVMRYIGNSHSHPGPDEIYREIQHTFPTLSRTTVYNSLHTLVDAGLVMELDIDKGNRRYDLALQTAHGHFICRRCGRISDIPLISEPKMTAPDGFKLDTVYIYGKGLCPQCADSKNINDTLNTTTTT